ncbi:MAG: HlyD family efflux transporter periplasmic adaptor subunit [Cyanobacteria bacterium P01_G01_bin.38]
MGKTAAVSGLPIPQVALVGLGLVALVLPFVGMRAFSPSASQSIAQADLNVSGGLSQRVAALGRIEPVDGVLTVGAPVNEILVALSVAEGDWVEQGTVIAYLRSHSERLAELAAAQQTLATFKARLQAETRYSQAQIEESAADYKALPAVQAERLTAQQARVDSLSRELEFARQELDRYQELYDQGGLARNDIEQRRTGVEQLVEQLRQAEAELQQQIAIRDRELANAEAQLNTLTAGAERIQAQSQVETALRDLQLAQVRVENSLIRAPISGRVLRVLTHAGETVSDTNGRGKGSVLDMANTRQMNVVAEVHETSIRQVQIGQSALVTSRNEAFEGELTGTVVSVGNQIFKKDVLNDDPTARVDARVVEVKILLDNTDAVASLTNLQVEVEIDTSTNATLPTTHEGT